MMNCFCLRVLKDSFSISKTLAAFCPNSKIDSFLNIKKLMYVHFQLMMVMLTSAGEMKMVEKIVGSKFIPYSFSVFFVCLFFQTC